MPDKKPWEGKTPEHAMMLKVKAAQDIIEPPKKTSSNPAFKGRNAKYAGLPETMQVIEPALEQVALGHTVFFQGRNIVYRLFDLDTGYCFDSALELPMDSLQGNVFQQIGQAFTYCRRYLAQAVFQLIPEDDDGNGAPTREAAPAATRKANTKTDNDNNEGDVL